MGGGGGGGFISAVTDPISSAIGTDGGGGGILGAVEDVGQAIGDAGEIIDKNVLQPAVQDPAGTVIKIGAIAAAPVTGGASLYAIPAYTAAKAIASGIPLDDVAKMTAISAAATAAGVSVADYVGTLAEFGTDVGSQQTAMLAAQNVGIGTGGAVSTAVGQTVGGAAGGLVSSVASGRDPVTGLITGAAGGAIGAGVNQAVDAGAGLFNGQAGTTTGNTGMEDNLFGPTYAELGYDPTASWSDADMQPGGFYGGGTTPTATILPGETEDIVLDANGNIVANSGAGRLNLEVAKSLGFDTTTLTNYAKQFGTAALKSLIGSAVNRLSPAQRTSLKQQGYTDAQIAAMGGGGLLGAGANYALSANQLRQQQAAYNQNVAAQQQATQQAVQSASFQPVGITTAFGQSQYQVDPATGRLLSAGYTATPEVAAQRQRLFGLGTEALPTTANTQDIQNQYIAQQRGLLAPGREQQFAQLQNKQFQTGRTGLATGGTVAGYAPGQAGLMQTNPEMAAYFNAISQQDAQLAANAPTYAQDLLNKQIATGTGLFTQAGALETMAQQPFTLGAGLGTAASTAGAKAGYYGLLGGQSAAASQLQGQLANIAGTGAAVGSAISPVTSALGAGIAGIVPKEWLV